MSAIETLKPLARPLPPADLVSIDGLVEPDRFVPAPPLLSWIRECYLHEDGLLFSADHTHLDDAEIGVLWTTAENTRHGRRIVGQAEMPSNAGGSGKWRRAKQEQQLREWFGLVPDFLLTFDAAYCMGVDDITFAALVDHELTHCAQQTDAFGAPKFSQSTGRPLWCMRGHDVEEFVSVVRRFGIQAAGEAATDLVIAAASPPEIAPAKIARVCGTCAKRAA